ncbi:MAG: nucleotide sugar dehydrogenase [Actinomycetota bacterium]|nr:nucleotide sugar dehydrogenase [Actinomycetota bacterium]
MNQRPVKVAVLGQGYVGLPLAILATEAGHQVVGYDPDEVRVASLTEGRSYVEDVSDVRLAAALLKGYKASTQPTVLSNFDVAVITVPTPLTEGVPDLSFVLAATDTVADFLRPGRLVVLESTTYPGTTEELLGPSLESRTGLVAGIDFHLAYSPERIDPGNPQFNLANTPKLVAGITTQSLSMALDFYSSIIEKVVPVSRPREAELAKLIENTFRHVNIALVNEIAMFAHDLGVDIWEALDSASTKPFGFMRFNPGPGVGGHCLPIDPSYLSWHVQKSLGQKFRFVELANDINDHMPAYVVQRLMEGLNERQVPLRGSKVMLVGLTYKPNTSDLRESPGLQIANRLDALGADLLYVDSHVPLTTQIECVSLSAETIADMDAVVILTDHDDVDYRLIEQCARYVLDTRRRCYGPQVERL